MRYLIYVVMASIMLHWPNMLYGYSTFTAVYLKNFLLLLSVGVFGVLGFRKVGNFAGSFFVMAAVAVIYCYINGLLFHSYVLRTIFFVLLCASFYQYPRLMDQFIKTGLLLSAYLGLQALILIILMLFDVTLPYDSINFVESGGSRDFNILAGFSNDKSYFRTISYFTETNRLAYFLTPSLFLSYYYSKDIFLYKIVFYLIVVAILSTFSVFSFFSIACGVLVYILYTRNSGKTAMLVFPFLVIIGYIIYSLNTEFLSWMFDKSGSSTSRILGILTKIQMVYDRPYGYDEATVSKMFDSKEATQTLGNSTLTLLNWSVIGGMQSAVLLGGLLLMWFVELKKLLKTNNKFLALLACGMIANLLQQSFYGSYFEYYFLGMMAIVTTYSKLLRRVAVLPSGGPKTLNAFLSRRPSGIRTSGIKPAEVKAA
jgi:hypothetical protein